MERRALISRSAMAYNAGLSGEIAKREIREAKKRLLDWPEDAFAIRTFPESVGPGNIVMIEAAYEHVTVHGSGNAV